MGKVKLIEVEAPKVQLPIEKVVIGVGYSNEICIQPNYLASKGKSRLEMTKESYIEGNANLLYVSISNVTNAYTTITLDDARDIIKGLQSMVDFITS